jgi:tRNA (guanine-N7-)-methyltransferase
MTANKTNLKELPVLLPSAVDFVDYFHNAHPVDLEIGCGRTHFFFDRAINFPERNIVGIEWKYEFIEQAKRRIVREGISNAAAFHGNAWLLVPLLFRASSISQVFVNFPDPWWKAKHKKRLVLNEVFLTALAKRMADDGFILLQTDVAQLFAFYQELIRDHGAFSCDHTMDEASIIAMTKAQTHREKKCLAQGMTIYRGVFRKKLIQPPISAIAKSVRTKFTAG